MIDVSDGLVADLSHIAELSGVGFELQDVPIATGATLDEALGGGDDYVLAFTMPTATGRPIDGGVVDAGVAESFVAAGLPAPYYLGNCVGDPAQRALAGRSLEPKGWEHTL